MKKVSLNPYRRIEEIVGCKWSVAVLSSVHAGITRPGELERRIDGISTRILNVRLRKLTDYGLLVKSVTAGKSLRTDYALTPEGVRFIALLEELRRLDGSLARPMPRSA